MIELGYREGRNFTFEYIQSPGIEGYDLTYRELVAREVVDILMAAGNEPALRAARAARDATPIVFLALDFDPVEKGYVSSLSRPGSNSTGIFVSQLELAGKRVELLREALPSSRRVGLLWDAASREQADPQRTLDRMRIQLLRRDKRLLRDAVSLSVRRQRLQSGLRDDGCGLCRRQKAQQRDRSIGVLRTFGLGADKKGRRLNLSRHRADEIGARDVDQFGDLLEADLRLPARDDRRHRLARWWTTHLARLAGDFIRDAKLSEADGRQIRTARTVRIRDGFRGE